MFVHQCSRSLHAVHRLSGGVKAKSLCQSTLRKPKRRLLFERLEIRALLAASLATDIDFEETFSSLIGTAEGELPTQFTNQVVIGGMNQPIGMTFLPNNKSLVIERDGTIFITDPFVANPIKTLYLQIPNVDFQGEKGLTSIVLDPNFATNNYFYVYYHNTTVDKARISRFVHHDDHAHATDEVLVWQDHLTTSNQIISDHWGGGMDFGPDGNLYLAIGDKKDNPDDSQDLTLAAGKIIRIKTSAITSDGTGLWVDGAQNDQLIPTDNPFRDGPEGNLDEIWARGLRNPFRAKWDLPTGKFYIAEVGGNIQSGPDVSHEDLHRVTVADGGANFGWPMCEGPSCAGAPPANYSAPIYSIQHIDSRAIVAGFIYRNGNFPATYDDALFISDYSRGWLRYLKFNAAGNVAGNVPTGGFQFSGFNDLGRPVMLAQGPEGSLYYIDIAAGTMRRIIYNGGNQPPVITAFTATPTSGAAPLSVQFSANAVDNENDPLTYTWNFGDGTQATGKNTTHVYSATGSYSVSLVVTDPTHNTSSNVPLVINVGTPPVATISSPLDASLFLAGQQITVSGSATDSDGPTPSLDWRVDFLHDDHTHPILSAVTSGTFDFSIPSSGHDFSGTTAFIITLKATDSTGLTDTKVVTIYPENVDLTLNTNLPATVNLTLDSQARTSPVVLDSLIGFQHSLAAPPIVFQNGHQYSFANWSDGVLTASRTITTPTSNVVLTANYVDDGPVLNVGPKLNTGIATVSTSDWTTVTLPDSYANMVVVATPVTDSNNPSVAVRLRNADPGNTFQVMLQRTGNYGSSADFALPVHYTVVEAGVYTQSQHGIKMEAIKTLSTVTDSKGSYVGQNVTSLLSNTYANPVVVGQVMTANDAHWSTFWSRGASVTVPAAANAVWVGKQVGSDPNSNRANEQIGFIIIEQGNGSTNGYSYSAVLGARSIDGVQNSGSSYLLDTAYPTTAVASLSGNTGPDGGWAVLYGDTPLTDRITLAVEEDQTQDFERNHNNENLSYVTFLAGSTSNQNPVANNEGGTGFTTNKNNSFATFSVLSNDADPNVGDVLTVQSFDTTDTLGTVTNNNNGTFDYNPNGMFESLLVGQTATDTFTYTISDGHGGTATATVTISITNPPVSTGPKLNAGIATVSTSNWTTVTLPDSYANMVVVATPVTDSNNPSVAVRLRNADPGNTFQVMLQRTGNYGNSADFTLPVHYTVVEAGVYTQSQHGIKMEAIKTLSTVTDSKGSFVGQNVTSLLSNTYANPVVVGQVMTANDAHWSTFWSHGLTEFDPATGSAVWIGKQVGSDPNQARANEQLGMIVIEQGNGSNGSFSYSAALGSSSIDGVQNNGSNYPLTITNPTSAVASISGIHGSDGGWAVLYGDQPLAGQLSLAIEEDQAQDFERSHANEHVAYILFHELSVPGGAAMMSSLLPIAPVIGMSDLSVPLHGTLLGNASGVNTLMMIGSEGTVDLSNPRLDISGFSRIDLTGEESTVMQIDTQSVVRLAPSTRSLDIVVSFGDQLLIRDASNWRMSEPQTVVGEFLLSATNVATGIEAIRVQTPNRWSNFVNPSDINNNGDVTAGDALEIILELNRRLYSDTTSGQLQDPIRLETWPGIYLDRNGDDLVSAADALMVINDLLRQSSDELTANGELVSRADIPIPYQRNVREKDLYSQISRTTSARGNDGTFLPASLSQPSICRATLDTPKQASTKTVGNPSEIEAAVDELLADESFVNSFS